MAVLAACGSNDSEKLANTGGPATHQLTLTVRGPGSAAPAGGSACRARCTYSYNAGTSVTLNASADAGALLDGFQGDCTGKQPCALTLDSDKNVEVDFFAAPATRFTLSVSVNGPGRVTSSPAAIDCGNACSAAFVAGTKVALTATSDGAATFAGWSGACTGSGTCVVSLDADRSVQAAFTPPPPPPPKRTLSVSVSGGGRVTSVPAGIDCGSTCSASFDDGTKVTLSAAPADGSTFSGWSGPCGGTDACVLTLTSDQQVAAAFATKPADECDGLRPGAVSAPVTFSPGDPSCLEATSDESGNLIISTSNALDLVDASGKLKAKVSGEYGGLMGQHDGGLAVLVQSSNGATTGQLVAFDGNGKVLGTGAAHDGFFLVRDPAGGALARVFDGNTVTLASYDARGAVRWQNTMPHGAHGIGIGLDGIALALIDHTPTDGPYWIEAALYDRNGKPIASYDADGNGLYAGMNAGFVLHPRIGGGLFLSFERSMHNWYWGPWFDASGAKPPPDWVNSRKTKMRPIRGNRAYAFLDEAPDGLTRDCVQQIEVVTPSGKSCGTASFRAAPGTCAPNSIDVGEDGTVIQASPEFANQCSWQFWPGFFR